VNHSDFTAPQTENVARPFDGHTAAYPDMPVFEPRATSLVVDTTWPLAGQGGRDGTAGLAYEHTLSITGLDVTRRATPGDGNADIDGTEVMFEPRLRFAPGGGQLRGIAGLYMFRAVQDEAIDLFGGSQFDDRITTVAAFGEATVTVRPTVDVILGGRYEQERHRRVGAGGPFAIDVDETYKVFSPKVGLAWRLTPEATVGATASRGYNAGGAGFTYDAPFVSYNYEPEFVWNYEAFLRADLDEDRLSLTANVFVSDYTDMQLPFDLNPDPDIWAFVVRNAEAARTYGAEIGTRYVGIPGWQFFADVGLLETKVTRYPGSGLEGTELPRAPAFTSSAGAAYRHPIGLDASADVRFSDAYYSEATNNPRGKVDPYCLVNAQVGYTISRARIAAVIGNLFDSAAPLLLEPGETAADDSAQILKPRTISVNLQVRF
jgi:outer membrane receptor protein involved in Fe transport